MITDISSTETLVDDILVRGMPMLISGSRLTLKTSVGLDLAISLASGTAFLDNFAVERPFKTLFLGDGDQASSSFRKSKTFWNLRKPKANATKDLMDQSNFCIDSEVPRPGDNNGLEKLVTFCKRKRFEVVVMDPTYIFMEDRESSEIQGEHYGMLCRMFCEVGITPVLLHSNYSVPDVSESAPPSFFDSLEPEFNLIARQWLFLSRRQAYQHDGIHRLWFEAGSNDGRCQRKQLTINEGSKPSYNSDPRSGRGTWTPTLESLAAA
ncbi:AAA family ATPase [Pirellulaceae bacterium]|nr:AAA family ATPase [Pirellulaceae bacterium]